jgi:hypothetical protein
MKNGRMSGTLSTNRTDEKYIPNSSCKMKRKRPLGEPRPRWEYNIKMKLGEIKGGNVDCIICFEVGCSGGFFEHGTCFPVSHNASYLLGS